ncbi:ATP-binding protein [Thermodesulfobacteriota bacterium]
MNSIFFKSLKEKFSIKLFVLFAFIVFIVFSSFTAIFIHLESKSLNDSLIKDGKLLTSILAQNTRIGVFSENENRLKDSVEAIFQRDDILSISIYNREGVLLHNKKRTGFKVPEKPKEEKIASIIKQFRVSGEIIYYKDQDDLIFWAPVLSRGNYSLERTIFSEESPIQKQDPLIGYVQVTVGNDKLNKQLNKLLVRSIIIAVIFLIAGFVFIYSAMKRVTKPLERLTVAANTFSAGKIVEKVDVETKDEIGNLANAFNNMVDSINWREQALKESEAKYRSLFEESRDVIFIINTEGKFIDANQAALDLFSYSKDEILAIGLDDLFLHPGEFKNIKEYIGTDNYIRNREVKFKKKDSSQLDCLLTLSVRKANGREILGYQGIIRDVTHQKALEMQLEQAQKMEAIGTLAGGIAHDFNNIISIIMGNTELAKFDVPEDNKVLKNLNEIYEACIRARDLVKQILIFSRQSRQEIKPIKLSKLIKGTLSLMRATIPSTIKIHGDIPDIQYSIMADETQINQIILNMCTNAAYAMKDKGGVLEIRLEHVILDAEKAVSYQDLEPGGYFELIFSDTGVGIDKEIVQRIFDPYFTTKERGAGTGLGLAMVHGIIKNHRGAIFVNSEVGKGSEFHILLPSSRSYVDDEMSEKISHPKGDERILLVDDEQSVITFMKSLLERLGYQLEASSNAIEALEIFKHHPDSFDLIITDMTMPDLTGLDLAREVIRICPDTPVIICTGYSDKIDEKKAKEIGASLIMKPYVISEVAVSIRKILDKNQ